MARVGRGTLVYALTIMATMNAKRRLTIVDVLSLLVAGASFGFALTRWLIA